MRSHSQPHSDDGTVAVLSSGGLDSAILVAELLRQRREVQPIYIRFGLVWEAVEEAHLRRFLETLPARSLVTLEFPIADVYGLHWSLSGRGIPDADTPDDAVYLPGRNLLLVAKSGVWCALHDITTIALGTLKGNPFPDSSAEFFASLQSVVHTGLEWPLQIVTPFSELTKAEVLNLGRGLQLQHTFSCMQPDGEHHCGRCNKCAERRGAFADLSVEDVTTYATY
jgi:7-cyano-7-deazaguanine synthase